MVNAWAFWFFMQWIVIFALLWWNHFRFRIQDMDHAELISQADNRYLGAVKVWKESGDRYEAIIAQKDEEIASLKNDHNQEVEELEAIVLEQDREIRSLKAKLAQQKDENEAMIKAEVDKRWPELKAAYLDKVFSDKSDD